MMKKLIKTVAMVSLIFLFTACDDIDEKTKEFIKNEIKDSIENKIKESEEIKSLKSKIDTLENLVKTQEKQKEQFNKMMN
jgi:SMC interacting uncharacterized protein involved in chromosome segregation